MTQERRWLGVHLNNHGDLSNDDMIDCAQLADDLGYSGVTMNEDVGHDAFALLGALSRSTKNVSLGTAIVNVYSRSAMQVAMGGATIDSLSHGRGMLAVSVGHHPWNDVYHGIPFEPPLPRLREYVTYIRGVLSGEVYHHDGRIFTGVETQLGFKPYRSDLPIFIGGDRGGVLKLAGEVADGALMNVVSSDYLESYAVDRVRSSAERAGRDPEKAEIMVVVTCCLGDDKEEALQRAKRAFVGRVRGSPEKMTVTRPSAEAELLHLRALIDAGKLSQAVGEVSTEVVTQTIAAGGPAEVRSTIDRFYAAGATRVLLAASPGTREGIEKLLRALRPVIGEGQDEGSGTEQQPCRVVE
jgi:alkanesulfonate monooxygenase SsuD/methylene tetrahydromethanopterin reductase-like flavin-dependent oxidoreductase (luciferase family)